jgi:hypothetical protein
MPFPREVFPFTARLITGAPDAGGIYVLWRDGEAIYIGAAVGRGGVTIRTRLAEHFSGSAGECTRTATHYSWEISLRPAARELELLEEFKSSFQRLPRCNLSGL